MAKSAGTPVRKNRARTGTAYSAGRNNAYYTEGSSARMAVPASVPRPYMPDHPRSRLTGSAYTAQAAYRAQERHPASVRAQRNRAKALSTNQGFVIFLALIMCAVIVSCVHYIRLKSEYTVQISETAELEAELSKLKEDNDAYYSAVTSNVDLDRIKKIAIGRLGMKYPGENQKQTYTTSDGTGYVRQYQDVPN